MFQHVVLTIAIAVLYSATNSLGIDLYSGAADARSALKKVKYDEPDYKTAKDTAKHKEWLASNLQLVSGALTLLAAFAIRNQAVSRGISLGGLFAVLNSLSTLWPTYSQGQRFMVTSITLIVLIVYGTQMTKLMNYEI